MTYIQGARFDQTAANHTIRAPKGEQPPNGLTGGPRDSVTLGQPMQDLGLIPKPLIKEFPPYRPPIKNRYPLEEFPRPFDKPVIKEFPGRLPASLKVPPELTISEILAKFKSKKAPKESPPYHTRIVEVPAPPESPIKHRVESPNHITRSMLENPFPAGRIDLR